MSDLENYTVKKAAQIIWILQSLSDNHDLIDLNFCGRDLGGRSMILGVDTKKQCFFIDPMKSDACQKQMLAKKPFNIKATLKGVDVVCQDLRLRHVSSDKDGEIYVVDLPSTISYMQRRNSFRAQVRGLLNVPVVITWPEKTEQQAAEPQEIAYAIDQKFEVLLDDVSTEGCRLVVTGIKEVVFEEPGTLLDLELNIPDKDDPIKVQIESRCSRYLERFNICYIGCRFVTLDRQQQIDINHFVAEMQRIKHQRLSQVA